MRKFRISRCLLTKLVLLWGALALQLLACNDDEKAVTNPFDTTSSSDNQLRNKIVVISDLHLGNDLAYSENVKHLKRLEQFLNEVRSSSTIKELVIAGDMIDEWYIPTRVNTYGGGTQGDFVRKSVAANQAIFNVLNGIIKDGHIKLTYIPGNHDMGFTAESVNIAMPGVNQARDAGEKYGVGTYHPDGYAQIAIEHGHRYDFFCAITPNANEADAPGATLPPGYFFARIAANSFTNPTTENEATKTPIVTLNDGANAEQVAKFTYYSLWQAVLDTKIYVKEDFSAPIITTNIGHFTQTYSINDILPYNSTDGSIQMKLYNGLFTQAKWDEREKYNNVTVMTNINEAIVGSLKTTFIDESSNVQYFQNSLSNARIVVFGHTHLPMIKSYTNHKGEACIYANSGTWEDQKTRTPSEAIDQDAIKMHFVVIYPEKENKNKLQVDLYQYRYGEHELVDSKDLNL